MNSKLQLFSLFMGLILILGATSGAAIGLDQGNSNNWETETDNLVIKVTGGGNVPKYTFWDPADNTTKYNVMFSQVFEAEDNADNGTQGVYDLEHDKKVKQSNVALPSLSWEFSEVEEDDNGDVHFNITSSDGMIIFANHLYASQDNSLKFDVIVNNYEFKSNESMLIFAFKLSETTDLGENATEAEQTENSLSFGDGFFESEDWAVADGEEITVGLSTGSEENDTKIYLAYQNFDGAVEMVHDPTMGVQAAAVNPNESSETSDTVSDVDTGLSQNEDITQETTELNLASDEEDAGISSVFATFVSIFVPVALYRFRK